jgi:alpha-galactosidase
MKYTTTAISLLLTALPCTAADNKVIWLDEMTLTSATSGWGTTQAKKTVANKPLTLSGKVYERGIGTHAPGALRIDLDKRASIQGHRRRG